MQFSTLAAVCLFSTAALAQEVLCNISIKHNGVFYAVEQVRAGMYRDFFNKKDKSVKVATCKNDSLHYCGRMSCKFLAPGFSEGESTSPARSGAVASLGRDPSGSYY
ncbi:hypothetical protein PpBr36_02044 [Pyricularia pennisetigena]|uniref:hypothetical protein n=1 Tax=Pyricularia pennisetigena TaxID=1578925 RepID=UPI0011506F8B|nr:hypothetical protein PpBr36_02044 [Pyricularia pennisetigena]TLS27818.1 hypothetical protein PpBr36_02044 [Pyricularia pennisetigena]